MRYFFNVDLGTMQDFTAISILERVPRRNKPRNLPDQPGEKLSYTSVYIMRHLERLPLGLDYPTIVSKIKMMLSHEKLTKQTALIVDETGVGAPVIQMMQQSSLSPIGIIITGGATVSKRLNGYNVPKGELVSALNLIFQARRIKIPTTLKMKPEFMKELERFKVTMNNTGVNTYEAAVASVHDDLVLSTAMGVWYAEKTEGHNYMVPGVRTAANHIVNPLKELI